MDEPLAPGIDQHARQQARLGAWALRRWFVTLAASRSERRPGLGVDQRPMLSEVELTLVRNLTNVNRVESSA